jgi:hypothetical protein
MSKVFDTIIEVEAKHPKINRNIARAFCPNGLPNAEEGQLRRNEESRSRSPMWMATYMSHYSKYQA